MCLEGMLTNAMSKVPVLKYFAPLISLIIFCTALYFSIMTGNAAHIIVAYFCPLLYIIYHFATKGKKSKTNLSENNSSNSDL